tara:strand:- start:19 stop:282 length:264 start_codon:yes stop_codon:yes gene_type:complete
MAILNKVNNTGSELDNYKNEVSNRFDVLASEEQSTLLSMYGTPELIVIAKVIGPEIHGVLSEKLNSIMNNTQDRVTSKPKRGLAARK